MAIRKKKESQYFVPKTAEDWAFLAEKFQIKKQPNVFQRAWGATKKGLSTALDVLSTPLYGVAGGVNALVKNFDDDVANDENPLKEIWKGLSWKEKETYFDVLESAGVKNKWAKGIIGTALNIAGDPISYMSGAGIIKSFNKINGKHLTGEGLKLFKEATSQTKAIERVLRTGRFGDDAEKTLQLLNSKKKIEFQLAQTLKADADKYFKGIEMFGQEIIPRQFISGGLIGKAMGSKTVADRIKDGQKLSASQKLWTKLDDTKTTFKEIVDDLFGRGKGVTGDVGFIMDNATGTIRRTTEELLDKIYNVNKTIKKKFGQEAIQEGVYYQLKLKSLYADKFKETIIDKADQIKKLTGISISKTKKITDERMDKIFGLIEDKVSDPKITKQARTLLDDMLHARSNAMDEINKLGLGELPQVGDMAKNFDNVDDYIKAQTEKGYRSTHQIDNKIASPITELKEETLTKFTDEFKRQYGYPSLKSKEVNKLKQIISNPEADVKIYRVSPKNELNTGDWVTIDKDYANDIKRQNGGKVYEYTVKSSDLYYPNTLEGFKELPSLNKWGAFQYQSSKTKSQLIEEWNKANKSVDTLSEGAKEYLKSMQPISQQIQNISGLKKGLNLYIPSLDKNYLMKMAKQGAGKNIRTKVWQEFNNKIATEDLVKNPMTAWGIKTYEVVKNKIANETKKNLVAVYGSKRATDVFTTPIMSGKKILGYLSESDAKFVSGSLNPEMKTIDNLARMFGYDQFTSLFKRGVTSLFPAFHVRNYISGIVQNYEVLGKEAFNPMNIWGDNLKVMKAMKGGTDEVVNWGGKALKLDDAARAFKNRYLDSGMYSFDNKEISNAIDGILGFKKKTMLPMEKIGQWTEMQQKAGAYVIALKKGNSIDDALKLAEQAGFDYRNLSNFESSVMKRLIPFYAFARKNAELQVKTLISTPARIANQKKILDGFSEIMGGTMSEEDIAGLPPWVKNALKIKIEGGRVVSGLDFPIQEFFTRLADPVNTTITSMNPLLKYPLESEAGYDFFRGKQIKDIKTIDKPLYDLLNNPKTPSFIRDIFHPTEYTYEVKIGKNKGEKKTVYEANPYALHKLRAIPTSRLQNTLETILGEGDKTDKVLSFFLGAKIYDIDNELQKYYEDRDLQQEIREYLMRIGGSYEMNIFNVPKSEIESQE